jgi:hypothetical protein
MPKTSRRPLPRLRDKHGLRTDSWEVDVHFPMLSVGDTLTLAAQARTPRNPPGGVSKNVWAKHLRDVFMVSNFRNHPLTKKTYSSLPAAPVATSLHV